MLLHCLTLAVAACAGASPWWDDFPTTVQTSDPAAITASGADSALCGMADDPVWGILGQRCRCFTREPQLDALARGGLKLLCWSEAFGTCEDYIAEFGQAPGGGLVGFDADPSTPRPLLNAWGWYAWKPQANRERHWVGVSAYYEDEPWLRPWTRTHPRYGAPPFRYPDGRVAEGTFQQAEGFALHRLYDAGCSKDVLGHIALDCDYSARVNEIDPATGQVRGPTEGLVRCETPQGIRYSGLYSAGKDFACPAWIEYACASARHMVDHGVRGTWADNYGAWDGFGSPPLRTGFGEWSVARFRDHLKQRFSPQRLREMGVEDVATFDVRTYLRRVLREKYGGDDTNLNDPRWSDPGWLDDAVWREYRLFKVRTGREALRAYHEAFHGAAREAGVDDFVIQGNDIPIWCFDLPRPDSLDMVSTEFAPGWNLLTGSRGNGLPPGGRMGPIIKMARTHAASRFVHVWYYLEGPYEKYRAKASVGRVLSYELLAHHAMIQAYPGNPSVAGTVESHREVTDFIHAAKGLWGDRRPLARIGLLYSPDSRLTALTPGPFPTFNAQQHVFDLLGWGTALSELHEQYAIVPEWDLNAASLRELRVLVIPSVEVLSPEAVTQVLRPWVAAGGRLVLSGPVGGRHDASHSHARVTNAAGMLPELCRLAGIEPDSPRPEECTEGVGRGQVILLPALGFDYYQQEPGKRDLGGIEPVIRKHLAPYGLVRAGLPRELEVSVFASPTRSVLFVDVANLDLDPDRDEQPKPHEMTLTIAPPEPFPAGATATVLQPGREPGKTTVRREGNSLVIGPVRVESYASVVMSATGG